MAKTVVRIQESWDGQTLFYLESPRSYPQASKMFKLQSNPQQTPFLEMRQGDGSPSRVREAGEKLFADLGAHPAVKPAIAAALLQAHGGYSPICFRLDDVGEADSLPWEAVRDATSEFLALDTRWPVVRVREVTESEPVKLYEFAQPVRIAAVLSVTGRDAQTRAAGLPQWERIRDTVVKHLSAPGALPVQVSIFTCEEDLRDAIKAENLPWASAALIADKEDLLDKLRDAQPNLLHFFCHGTSDQAPQLQIGARKDWEGDRDPSIALDARELRQRVDDRQTVWLVTLNCCESALRARDARSLANSLVAAGFPAAVGMREEIDVTTAHLLCEFFYKALLRLINAIPEGGAGTEIEWAVALTDARSALVSSCGPGGLTQQAAVGCKVWTVPALYTRREPLFLKRLPGTLSKGKQDRIDAIRALQQQRTKAAEDYKDMPAEVLANILKEYDTKIAAEAEKLKNAL